MSRKFVTINLLGVPQSMTFAVSEPEVVWDELQESDWVVWEAPGSGHTVALRSAYVTAVRGHWDTEEDLGPGPAPPEVQVWTVGSQAPLIVTADDEDWPMPAALLWEDESEWIGWTDASGGPVMFQVQHVTALIYPTAWDERVRAAARASKRKKRK